MSKSVNWGPILAGAGVAVASGIMLTLYREERNEKRVERKREALALLITEPEDEDALGAEMPPRVVGIELPRGEYWGDLIPTSARWLEILSAFGVDRPTKEWFDGYRRELEKWARSQGADVTRWELIEPSIASALGSDRTRAFVAFRVKGPALAQWGPKEIKRFGFVPTLWKGSESPSEAETIQAPRVQSTSEALQSLAESIVTKTVKTAGTLLGVGLAGLVGVVILTSLAKRAQSPRLQT